MRGIIAVGIVSLLLLVYEIFFLLASSLENSSLIGPFLQIDLDGVIDRVVGLYSVAVVLFILRYRALKIQSARAKAPVYLSSSLKKQAVTKENWKEKLQGVWQQFKADGLDEFAALTEPSALRRTLGAIAFFKVRHTISIQDGYFILQRDLGMAVSVWNLKAPIGASKEMAQRVSVPVESGGNYLFRIWINEENKELLMESAPAEGSEGVTTIQTRSLVDNDLMKMVSALLPFSPPSYLSIPSLLSPLCSIGRGRIRSARPVRWFLISREWTPTPSAASMSGTSSEHRKRGADRGVEGEERREGGRVVQQGLYVAGDSLEMVDSPPPTQPASQPAMYTSRSNEL
jgi:hypothetical protein